MSIYDVVSKRFPIKTLEENDSYLLYDVDFCCINFRHRFILIDNKNQRVFIRQTIKAINEIINGFNE